MPDQDHDLARRGVLRGAAGIGAAGLAAGLLTVTKTGTAHASDEAHLPTAPLVVHVHDARTGVVDLYTGTRHVRVIDLDLAARLARVIR